MDDQVEGLKKLNVTSDKLYSEHILMFLYGFIIAFCKDYRIKDEGFYQVTLSVFMELFGDEKGSKMTVCLKGHLKRHNESQFSKMDYIVEGIRAGELHIKENMNGLVKEFLIGANVE